MEQKILNIISMQKQGTDVQQHVDAGVFQGSSIASEKNTHRFSGSCKEPAKIALLNVTKSLEIRPKKMKIE